MHIMGATDHNLTTCMGATYLIVALSIMGATLRIVAL